MFSLWKESVACIVNTSEISLALFLVSVMLFKMLCRINEKYDDEFIESFYCTAMHKVNPIVERRSGCLVIFIYSLKCYKCICKLIIPYIKTMSVDTKKWWRNFFV